MRTVIRLFLVMFLVLVAAPARAQVQQTLKGLLSFLLTNQAVATGQFEKDQAAAAATSSAMTRALLAGFATLPISASSGGFVYRFNATLGTVERTSSSFGPFFAERALTSGRGSGSLGLTFRHSVYASIDGRDLRNGAYVIAANQFRDEAAPFDTEALRLNLATDVATVFGTVGLGDRMDLSAALPLVRLTIDGERLNTYRGQTFQQASATGVATGIADLAVRTKVQVYRSGASGVSAGAEVRLPTGREVDLLGTGETALRLMGIGSVENGRVGVHGNAAFGFGGLSREFAAGGAVAVAANPWLTLSGELLLRRLASFPRLEDATSPHPLYVGVNTLRVIAEDVSATQSLTTIGFKWNVASTWLVHGHLQWALTHTGLKAGLAPTFGIDYAFAQ